jgi:hypothetical protein
MLDRGDLLEQLKLNFWPKDAKTTRRNTSPPHPKKAFPNHHHHPQTIKLNHHQTKRLGSHNLITLKLFNEPSHIDNTTPPQKGNNKK